LSKEQKDAILEAHNIWNRLENSNYSIWDLKKKVEILQKLIFFTFFFKAYNCYYIIIFKF
jgi:hypothetical protein